MNIATIGAPKIIMSNPESKHNYFAWPTATRLQNGKIAVVASGFRIDHVCPFGKTVIAYSEDEGESYTAPAPVLDTPLDDRDGGILAFGNSGVIVTSFNNTVAFQRGVIPLCGAKEYRGAYLDTVSAEEEEKYLGVTFRISLDRGVTFGPIYKSPVTSPHGPAVLSDGSILWVGKPFATAEHPVADDRICAYRLDPANGEMTLVGKIENARIDGKEAASCEPHAFEAKDGRILCHIRVEESSWQKIFTTYQSESCDGGKTWSEPTAILSATGGAPAHIMRHSSGALISVMGYRKSPFGIKAAVSLDEGKTWDSDHDVYVNGVSHDIGYPSTVELTDGSLITVFYAHPEAGAPAVIMQQKWALSL